MRTIKQILKWTLAVVFIAAGVYHFLNPAIYLRIMPPVLPAHLFLIYLSGFFQIAFGVLLLIPKYMSLAACGLIALLVAVFPANVYMAMNAALFPEINPMLIWIRLPLQLLPIIWAAWYIKPDRKGKNYGLAKKHSEPRRGN